MIWQWCELGFVFDSFTSHHNWIDLNQTQMSNIKLHKIPCDIIHARLSPSYPFKPSEHKKISDFIMKNYCSSLLCSNVVYENNNLLSFVAIIRVITWYFCRLTKLIGPVPLQLKLFYVSLSWHFPRRSLMHERNLCECCGTSKQSTWC